MTVNEDQKTSCPVCNRSDQVKTMQAAYNSGVARCAPPDMPAKQVPMLLYMLTGTILVGLCIFLIIVLIGSEANLGFIWQLILVCVTLVCILAALALSFFAFQRVVQGDAESTIRLPAWDQAMATWRNLRYCSRDDVVFDPQTNKQVSNEQLAKLRAADTQSATLQSAMAH